MPHEWPIIFTLALDVGIRDSLFCADSPRVNKSFLRWLDWLVPYFPQWQTWDWQITPHHGKRLLSILTVLAAHSNITIRSAAGADLKRAASFSAGVQADITGYPPAKWNENKCNEHGFFPLQDTSPISRHSTWFVAVVVKQTHWLFPAQSLVCFREAGNLSLAQRCINAQWNPEAVCSSKYASHVAESCLSSPGLQRPADTQVQTWSRCPSRFVHCCSLSTCLHCGMEGNWKLWEREREKKKWNEVSLSISGHWWKQKKKTKPMIWCQNVGALVPSSQPRHRVTPHSRLQCVFVFKYPVRDDLWVDTLIDVLLRSSSRKIRWHYLRQNFKLACSQSSYWMCNHGDNGWVTYHQEERLKLGRQKQICSQWAILCITLIAFLNFARSLQSSRFCQYLKTDYYLKCWKWLI